MTDPVDDVSLVTGALSGDALAAFWRIFDAQQDQIPATCGLCGGNATMHVCQDRVESLVGNSR